MATFRIPIFGFATLPGGGGDTYFETASVTQTNDLISQLVARFQDTATKIGIGGRFVVPKNYVGSPKIIVMWTSTATSGNVVWDFDYVAIGGNDSESLDPSAFTESVTVTDAAPTASQRKLDAEMSLTAGNLAADDIVEFLISRDGASGSDTMAAAAILYQILFEYTDS